MRLFIRFVVVLMLMNSIPAIAQTPSPTPTIDPQGEFTETYTFENITLRYPLGLFVTSGNKQITISFDGLLRDFITIAPPQAFEYFGIPNDTLEIATQAVYDTFIASFPDETRTYDEIVEPMTFAGYEMNTFLMQGTMGDVYAYVFAIDDHIFAVTHIVQGNVYPIELERQVLERIIEGMVIDGVSPEATPDIFAEATPDIETTPSSPDSTANIRSMPPAEQIEAVELGQVVRLYDGQITINIPAAWVVDEGVSAIATSEAVLSQMYDQQAVMSATDGALQIIPPTRMSELGISEINAESVTRYLHEYYPDAVRYTYADAEYPFYYLAVVGEDIPTGAFIWVWQYGDNPQDVVVFLGTLGDYAAFEPILLAIRQSLVYTAP
jgi:hypothetical protein